MVVASTWCTVWTPFLVTTNHQGEHLVFHSLRHTCGAWLAMAGESIKVVQAVMRHSTPVLTLNTYGHLFPGQCESAPLKLASMMRGDKTPADLSRTSHVSGPEKSKTSKNA